MVTFTLLKSGEQQCDSCGKILKSYETYSHCCEAKAAGAQVGGDHYRKMAIQPVEYIHRNSLGFCEGAIIKYVSRWRSKNGIEDLKKARHFIDLLIDLEQMV